MIIYIYALLCIICIIPAFFLKTSVKSRVLSVFFPSPDLVNPATASRCERLDADLQRVAGVMAVVPKCGLIRGI